MRLILRWSCLPYLLLLLGVVGLCRPLPVVAGIDDPPSDGKKTQIIKDNLKKKKVKGKTVYKQTVKIKNKTKEEITMRVTSHPWNKPGKFKKGPDGEYITVDGKLVAKEREAGKFGARQEKKDIKIAAGKTATVKFIWSEKWKWRYTDVYVDEKFDSGTNSTFDVSNLSPTSPLRVPTGGQGEFALEQIFPYPFKVFEDGGPGPLLFELQPDVNVLPSDWQVDYGFPALNEQFLLEAVDEGIELDISVLIASPALPSQEGLVSYYMVQPELGYRYHVISHISVPEPPVLVLFAVGLLGVNLTRIKWRFASAARAPNQGADAGCTPYNLNLRPARGAYSGPAHVGPPSPILAEPLQA